MMNVDQRSIEDRSCEMETMIDHKCGHSVVRDLKNASGGEPGPSSLKKGIEYWSSKDCVGCWKDGKVAELEAVQNRHDLPQLVGSDKQVAWAEKIRLQVIGKLDWVMANPVDCWFEGHDPEMTEDQRNGFITEILPFLQGKYDLVLKVVDAKFWIDVRDEKWSLVLGHADIDSGKVVLNWRAEPKEVYSQRSHRYIRVGGTKVYKNEMKLAD
jgi:hypothetical protein